MLKKILILMTTIALVISMCACGNKSKEDAITDSQSFAEGLLPYNDDPDGLSGDYKDSVSKKASLSLSYDNTREIYGIVVEWPKSETVNDVWVMTGYMNDSDQIVYEDCIYVTIDDSKADQEDSTESASDETFSYATGGETLNYESGEGYITVKDGKLYWDGAADEDCKECVFEK